MLSFQINQIPEIRKKALFGKTVGSKKKVKVKNQDLFIKQNASRRKMKKD